MQISPINKTATPLNEISLVERRNNLWSAYEQYMHDQISAEELEAIVSRNTPRLFEARRNAFSSILDAIHDFITSDEQKD